MGTLTSYVGALDAAKSAENGSAGFSWINIIHCTAVCVGVTLKKVLSGIKNAILAIKALLGSGS
jgi:hypothetical protein